MIVIVSIVLMVVVNIKCIYFFHKWQLRKHQYKIAHHPGTALDAELSRITLLLHPYYGHFIDMRSLSSPY